MNLATCVTISYGKVRGGARNWRYWQPALYCKVLQKNGKLKWHYLQHLGIARRSRKLAMLDANNFAHQYGCPFIEGVRHYDDALAQKNS